MNNISSLPDFTAYIDILIIAIAILCSYPAYKRGFLKEFFITIIYIPYIAALFYMINEFFQDSFSFDSLILKLSAFGAGYIALLVFIYAFCKFIKSRYIVNWSASSKIIQKILACFLNIFRTFYFILLCLILYNLHINKPELLKNSKILNYMHPIAEKTQNYLLKKDYINNEIILYEEEYVTDKERLGYKVHPIIKKIKKSKKYQEFKDSGMEEKIQEKVTDYLKRNMGL